MMPDGYGEEEDIAPLVDLTMINQGYTNHDEYRIQRGSLIQRIILTAVQILYGLFWHPCSSPVYQNNRSQKWVNGQVRNQVNFLDQLMSLKQKRDGFTRTQDDIKARKVNLEDEMSGTERKLFKYREEYKEKQALQESVHRVKSEIYLSLSKYERCNKSYSLFNDVLDVIHKTLSEIAMTEQLANLCGTVQRTNAHHSNEYSSMENTVHQLVRDIARYEQTKSQIECQLSLAKSRNVEVALHIGSDVDVTKTHILAEKFINSGEINFDLHQDVSPSIKGVENIVSETA
jgi:hypothetical protein